MGAKEEYKARNAAREARRAEQRQAPKKEPWWFRQPLAIDRFTGWLAIYTGLLFFATIISACILYKTDETLRHTLVATTRPWIEPTKIEITSFAIIDNELITNIAVHYLNVGHSPAQSVDIRVSISGSGTGADKAAAECLRDPPTDVNRSPQSVFPDQADAAPAN